MSFRDNGDLRIQEPGWFWAEEELFTVFAPIVGPHGLAVYAAMARLVPLAGVDRDKQIRVRRVMEWASVGRSKTAEEMRRLINMGMIIETKYLDGRDPTYKLASLKRLAKVGQKELMRRAGYEADAPMPFDQREKNTREKSVRKEKARQQQMAQELPLLDDENESDESESRGDGVRHTDTTPEVPGADESVRAEDTVSTTRQHASVIRQSVSAGADTLLINEEKKREENLKPPYPLSGDELDDPDQARPELPYKACTFGDRVGFDRSAPIAAQWVMAQLGITKRKLLPVIEAQLSLYCRNNRSVTLEEAAALMCQKSRELHDAERRGVLLHRPWGWERWFGEGHWTRPIPYDRAKLRSEASVGSSQRDADVESRNAEYLARAVKHLHDGAEAMRGKQLDGFASRLHELADELSTGLELDEAEKRIDTIEQEIYGVLLEGVPAEHRPQLRKEAMVRLGTYGQRVQGDLLEKVIAQAQERILFERRDVPKLSLLYMTT